MDSDLEKKRSPSSEDKHSNTDSGEVVTARNDAPFFTRLVDSFRQNPHARLVATLLDDDGRPLVNQPAAQPALAMKLKNRHLQMIAIGGSIGEYAP